MWIVILPALPKVTVSRSPTLTPLETSRELPAARLALYELISMLPPFSTIGCVNAPALPMRSSVYSPRVLSDAPGERVKKPRVPSGTGASAPLTFSSGNSAA